MEIVEKEKQDLVEKVDESKKGTGNQNYQKPKKNIRKNLKIVAVCALIIVLMGSFYYFNSMKEKERLAEEERIRIEQEQKDNEFKHTIAVTANRMVKNTSIGSKFITTYIELYNKYYLTLGTDYVKNTIQSSGSDEKFKTAMEENDGTIRENMKWFAENRSETYNDVYEVLLEMYDNYRYFYDKAIDLSINPSNLDEVKKKGNNVLEKVNRIIVMQPDIEDTINGKVN